MDRDAYDDARYDVTIEVPRGGPYPSCAEVEEAVRALAPPRVAVRVHEILPAAG